MKSNADTPTTMYGAIQLGALWRHKGKALLAFVLTMVVIAAVILLRPKSYSSEAKLYLRIGRETVALDPTATTGTIVGVKISRDAEINSVLEILRSRTIVEKVVDTLGADKILATANDPTLLGALRQQVSHTRQHIKAMLQAFAGSTPTSDLRETAISYLTSNLSVRAPVSSPVIAISCRAQSPELAQQIVATVIDVHAQEHLRLNRTSGSAEFFQDQTRLVGRQLSETKQRLHSLKNRLGIASLDGQVVLLEAQKAEIQEQLLRNERELATSEARYAALKKSLGEVEPNIFMSETRGADNPAADGMRQKLYDLEAKERELLGKYVEDHPFVRQIAEEVAHMRKVHLKESDTRTRSTYEINPTWQTLQQDFWEENARLAALKATNTSLKQQHAAVLADLRKSNEHSLEIEDLQRKADLLSIDYKTYSEKLELARIDAALQKHQITNINVLQSATLTTKPIGPSKSLMAGMGILIALINGCGIALLADRFDASLKSPAEVEQTVGWPVLTSLPETPRQRVHV